MMSPHDIEGAVYDLNNAIKIVSVVVAYSLEHGKGATLSSDHNLHVRQYDVDASMLLAAAELASDLYGKVTAPAVT